ncbi:ABC transporter ATP-binding protein [Cytophagales bacterium LB-30]|uniref:ABC transporter ATP-binding protein n=1 Tax=Shiella aurantiaca TaxID=3058365 RepID=A0ABT8F119_9BACT|nr:ABC transporter ATP-binding protein [Shiella aurantiaca]MDN4163944.1 ABC transporter ATP-binding protein [Shiella aurantiaca]
MNNTLEITELTKTYPNGIQALNSVSLRLSNGMFGLLGPNGAGKSTLMKTLAGLQAADSGRIMFNGIDLAEHPDYIKKQLGFLPQDFGVYPKVSAYDLLMHLAVLKGLTNAQARKEQVLSLLDKVNLYAFRHKEVHTFSGGMRQRFGIAQALLGNPQLVIVDEPTAGLDPEERNRFNDFLAEIGEDIIVILSTHLVEDVKNLCTQMAIMNHGTVLAMGAPTDFLQAMKGRLWEKTIARKERAAYESQYRVLSSQLTRGQLSLHIESEENPQNGFSPLAPNLEDVYFSYLKKSAHVSAATL